MRVEVGRVQERGERMELRVEVMRSAEGEYKRVPRGTAGVDVGVLDEEDGAELVAVAAVVYTRRGEPEIEKRKKGGMARSVTSLPCQLSCPVKLLNSLL